MIYTSTRDKSVSVTASQAIAMGISKEGGLFVPESFPHLSKDDIEEMVKLDYKERAKRILSLYLTDFTQEELSGCVDGAYGTDKFISEKIAPVVPISDNASILELWGGPTCAFKDMALQLLPHLLTTAMSKSYPGKGVIILVATSGDTGKAALEGFKDVPNTKIFVFYPSSGVSDMQKYQMITQEGKNVNVCAIKGNFDDAQSAVKKIFTDADIASKLNEKNMMFSSANSINWGRLAPQIVYYISAYCDMILNNRIKNGGKINVVVPTGNFGNILAAYYAKKMGLPINKLVCASNRNNILTDFLTTGRYDLNRDFYTTSSPSMDILISSNLERLLFDACGKDDNQIRQWMNELKENKSYKIGDDLLLEIKKTFKAGFCDDEGTDQSIKETYTRDNYLCDTHTAVAVCVYRQNRKKTGDNTPTVIASTASPFKFPKSVLNAIMETPNELDDFKIAQILSEKTGTVIPKPLADLENKKIRFTDVCSSDTLEQVVLSSLGI